MGTLSTATGGWQDLDAAMIAMNLVFVPLLALGCWLWAVFRVVGLRPRADNTLGSAPAPVPPAGALTGSWSGQLTNPLVPVNGNSNVVFTAKAVRNAGGGSRRKGAARMYKLMKKLEGGPV